MVHFPAFWSLSLIGGWPSDPVVIEIDDSAAEAASASTRLRGVSVNDSSGLNIVGGGNQ